MYNITDLPVRPVMCWLNVETFIIIIMQTSIVYLYLTFKCQFIVC